MFTIEQIDDVHRRFGKAATLGRYLEELRAIGVAASDSFLVDGHSEYRGANGHKVVTAPAHERLTVAETSDREAFLAHVSLHQQGKTDYFEMSRGLAASGIEKWTFDTGNMTITYSDKAGNALLVEAIR